MNVGDMIAAGSAAIALISMAGSFYFSKQATAASQRTNQDAERANDIAIGQTETSLREQIQSTRNRSEDCMLKIVELMKGRQRVSLSPEEEVYIAQLELTYRSAIEGHLNAFEDACGKYLDKKIDLSRFEKMYRTEIQTVCDHTKITYEPHMHPESNSKFQAIWKVHQKWFKVE